MTTDKRTEAEHQAFLAWVWGHNDCIAQSGRNISLNEASVRELFASHDCLKAKLDRSQEVIAELKAALEKYEAVLRKISKPALGGKTQQWLAAQALRDGAKATALQEKGEK